jgi:hypothetical protein
MKAENNLSSLVLHLGHRRFFHKKMSFEFLNLLSKSDIRGRSYFGDFRPEKLLKLLVSIHIDYFSSSILLLKMYNFLIKIKIIVVLRNNVETPSPLTRAWCRGTFSEPDYHRSIDRIKKGHMQKIKSLLAMLARHFSTKWVFDAFRETPETDQDSSIHHCSLARNKRTENEQPRDIFIHEHRPHKYASQCCVYRPT